MESRSADSGSRHDGRGPQGCRQVLRPLHRVETAGKRGVLMGKVTEKIRPNLFFLKRADDHFEMRFKNKRFCGTWKECEDWLRLELRRPARGYGQNFTRDQDDGRAEDSTD